MVCARGRTAAPFDPKLPDDHPLAESLGFAVSSVPAQPHLDGAEMDVLAVLAAAHPTTFAIVRDKLGLKESGSLSAACERRNQPPFVCSSYWTLPANRSQIRVTYAEGERWFAKIWCPGVLRVRWRRLRCMHLDEERAFKYLECCRKNQMKWADVHAQIEAYLKSKGCTAVMASPEAALLELSGCAPTAAGVTVSAETAPRFPAVCAADSRYLGSRSDPDRYGRLTVQVERLTSFEGLRQLSGSVIKARRFVTSAAMISLAKNRR